MCDCPAILLVQRIICVVFSQACVATDCISAHGLLTCDSLQALTTCDELRGAALLVFANKQDLPDAMTAVEITEVAAAYSQFVTSLPCLSLTWCVALCDEMQMVWRTSPFDGSIATRHVQSVHTSLVCSYARALFSTFEIPSVRSS